MTTGPQAGSAGSGRAQDVGWCLLFAAVAIGLFLVFRFVL
jgi:hypothetical protein